MSSKTLAMKLIAVLGSATLVFLVGCGGNTSQPPPPSQPTAVIVSPSSATVQTGGVQQFTATVSPSGANQAVTWSLSGTGCTGASCGTIDATGKYTAPASVPNPPTVTVRATSVADSAKAAIAAVNIMTAVNNPIPAIIALQPGATAAGGPAFTLIVYGSSNFVTGSVVRWNGSDRPTAFLSAVQVSAQIPASDIAVSGIAAITVFNPAPGGGSSNSFAFNIGPGPVSVAVAPDPSGKFGKFAYVANINSKNVSMYTINATTGALTSIGTIAAGRFPQAVAVDPSGRFAYVASADNDFGFSSLVSMFTINATTGVLTSIGAIDAGITPASVAVDPSGRFAYAASNAFSVGETGNVFMYTINATTGALTSIGTIAAGTSPSSVAVDPSGKFAYVANADSNTVSMYTINATTGALTSIGTIAAGLRPRSVAVDPSGKFAYVANGGSNDVSMYAINATTGALTSIGTIAAGTSPSSVAVDPSGKFAYVANYFSNSISMYTIDATTGALTLIGTIGM